MDLTHESVIDADDDAPLAQADIFGGVDPSTRAMGIVITGDCDLAQGKAWGMVNWVPVVTARSYLASSLGYDELETQVGLLHEQTTAALNKARQARGWPPQKDALIRAAAQQGHIDALRDVCNESEQPALAEQYDLLVRGYQILRESPARHANWSDAQVGVLIAFVAQLYRARNVSRGRLSERLRQRLTNPPGDVFLLPHVLDGQHVALLRFIHTSPADHVALTIGRARANRRPFYRFARLTAPYRYDLTRRLGSVFGDIGLPDHYVAHRNAGANNLLSSWKEMFE